MSELDREHWEKVEFFDEIIGEYLGIITLYADSPKKAEKAEKSASHAYIDDIEVPIRFFPMWLLEKLDEEPGDYPDEINTNLRFISAQGALTMHGLSDRAATFTFKNNFKKLEIYLISPSIANERGLVSAPLTEETEEEYLSFYDDIISDFFLKLEQKELKNYTTSTFMKYPMIDKILSPSEDTII